MILMRGMSGAWRIGEVWNNREVFCLEKKIVVVINWEAAVVMM